MAESAADIETKASLAESEGTCLNTAKDASCKWYCGHGPDSEITGCVTGGCPADGLELRPTDGRRNGLDGPHGVMC